MYKQAIIMSTLLSFFLVNYMYACEKNGIKIWPIKKEIHHNENGEIVEIYRTSLLKKIDATAGLSRRRALSPAGTRFECSGSAGRHPEARGKVTLGL